MSRKDPEITEGLQQGGVYYAADTPKGTGELSLLEYDAETYEYLNHMYNDFDRNTENTSKAQQILSEFGYYDGDISGIYDNKTAGALRRYLQNRNDDEMVFGLMEEAIDEMEGLM